MEQSENSPIFNSLGTLFLNIPRNFIGKFIRIYWEYHGNGRRLFYKHIFARWVEPERHRINLQYLQNKVISFAKMDSWIRPQFLISIFYIYQEHRLKRRIEMKAVRTLRFNWASLICRKNINMEDSIKWHEYEIFIINTSESL